MWRKICIHLHGIHLSVKGMKCVPYWLKNRASKERYTKRCMETSCDIAIGQETQIYIYDHKWSISFYKAILMKITPVQEHCTEKLYTEFDQNWARNVENRSKYLFTHKWNTALYELILMNTMSSRPLFRDIIHQVNEIRQDT